MEELAKLEAERGNPEYLEGGKEEQGFKGQSSFRGQYSEGGYIHGGRSENGFVGGHRRGQGSISSEMKRTDRGIRQENAGKNRRASNEMCTFLILNISSLQLIPVNMIAYRSQYGSANPTAIIAPAIAATLFSSLVAVVYCKVKDHSAWHTSSHKTYGAAELTASEIMCDPQNRGRKLFPKSIMVQYYGQIGGKQGKKPDTRRGCSLLPTERKGRGGKAI